MYPLSFPNRGMGCRSIPYVADPKCAHLLFSPASKLRQADLPTLSSEVGSIFSFGKIGDKSDDGTRGYENNHHELSALALKMLLDTSE